MQGRDAGNFTEKATKVGLGNDRLSNGTDNVLIDIVVGVVVDPAICTPERVITWTMMHWVPRPICRFLFLQA